jgi:hypothetical protein
VSTLAQQKMIAWRKSGAGLRVPVPDSGEEEGLASGQKHAKRKHAMDVTFEQTPSPDA